ncbi:MAG: NAD(+) synthase [Sphingobacteriales bacterium]|nr:NAD(+) synthase [Sphingobacteriales bacterium]
MAGLKILNEKSFEIDSQQLCSDIETFISTKFIESKKNGILVPVSGGLDSSVAAALVTRAIGKDRVTALMLPERFGNPAANLYGKLIIRQLGIKSKKIYINPIIHSLKISDPLLTFLGGRQLWKNRIEKIKRKRGDEVYKGYLKTLRGERVETFQKYSSKINGRQRARLLYACKYAEDNNLLLVGATHKTERSVGLFAKFGIDDCADLMPLKNFYRSQLLQIGQHVGIPAKILNRTPNPDMVPGVTDKYVSYLELPAPQVDLILLGLENKMTAIEIAEQLKITEEKILDILEIVNLTEMQRNHSLAPIMTVKSTDNK